eukprot:SAG31_NODE_128_length_23532_cov_21.204754_6_plen_90_part_00
MSPFKDPPNTDDSFAAYDYMRRLVAKGKVNEEDIAEAIELGTEWSEKHGLDRGAGTTANPPSQPPSDFVNQPTTLGLDEADNNMEESLL